MKTNEKRFVRRRRWRWRRRRRWCWGRLGAAFILCGIQSFHSVIHSFYELCYYCKYVVVVVVAAVTNTNTLRE